MYFYFWYEMQNDKGGSLLLKKIKTKSLNVQGGAT
jgi:hypothetical protein